jgi:hypothetical protein
MFKRIVKRVKKRGNKVTYTLRFFVKLSNDGIRSANFTLSGLDDPLYKNHQHLTNLFYDIEDRQRDGGELSDQSKEVIREINSSNPDQVQEWIDQGWFRSITSHTLKDAFDLHIEQKERDGKSKQTIRNWKNTAQRIYIYLDPKTPVVEITLRQVKEVFGKLRQHEKRWGEKFAASTLQKDAKNLREVFADLLQNKDITENPIARFRFKVEKWQRSKPVQGVDENTFRRILDKAFSADELQQKTLLAYYRIMSARQNDPRFLPEEDHVGDHWADVDIKRKMINRWNIKHKAKQGYQPVPELMWTLLMAWREEVISKNGKAEGPIFPWLNESTSSNQYDWFKRRINRIVPGCWEGLLKALRASRSREVRRMDNGRFLESQIVGHSEEVADKHYDDLEHSDFEQIWNDPTWKSDDEGTAA